MSLETIYYVGQTISVLAVVLSLVFVGIQVRLSSAQTRQANQLARAENRRELISQYGAIFELASSNPENVQHLAQCYLDYENAPPIAQALFANNLQKVINVLEQALYLYDEKLLDDVTLQALETGALIGIAMPGGRQFWSLTKSGYNERLRSHIDRLLEERSEHVPKVDSILPFFNAERFEDRVQPKQRSEPPESDV